MSLQSVFAVQTSDSLSLGSDKLAISNEGISLRDLRWARKSFSTWLFLLLKCQSIVSTLCALFWGCLLWLFTLFTYVFITALDILVFVSVIGYVIANLHKVYAILTKVKNVVKVLLQCLLFSSYESSAC